MDHSHLRLHTHYALEELPHPSKYLPIHLLYFDRKHNLYNELN